MILLRLIIIAMPQSAVRGSNKVPSNSVKHENHRAVRSMKVRALRQLTIESTRSEYRQYKPPAAKYRASSAARSRAKNGGMSTTFRDNETAATITMAPNGGHESLQPL